jgi:hypothetical protein
MGSDVNRPPSTAASSVDGYDEALNEEEDEDEE